MKMPRSTGSHICLRKNIQNGIPRGAQGRKAIIWCQHGLMFLSMLSINMPGPPGNSQYTCNLTKSGTVISYLLLLEKIITSLMACALSCCHFQLFATPMDCSLPGSSVHGIFFRQEYWSGLPFPPPGNLPDPEFEPTSHMSPALQADSSGNTALTTILQHCYPEHFIKLSPQCQFLLPRVCQGHPPSHAPGDW